MTFRNLIASKQNIGIAAVVILLSLALTIFIFSNVSGTAQGSIWYYDLQTQELVAVQPPLDGSSVILSSGNVAVQARVFTCGQAESEAEPFVGYLEKPNPTPPEFDPEMPRSTLSHRLVAAAPQEGQEPIWFVATSDQGAVVIDFPTQRCGNSYRENLP